MHPSFPQEPHRGPMPEEDARDWIKDAESEGIRKGAFLLARRSISPWEVVE